MENRIIQPGGEGVEARGQGFVSPPLPCLRRVPLPLLFPSLLLPSRFRHRA